MGYLFWTCGISNSIDILEQMTYLFFMKLLYDKQLTQEAMLHGFDTYKETVRENVEYEAPEVIIAGRDGNQTIWCGPW